MEKHDSSQASVNPIQTELLRRRCVPDRRRPGALLDDCRYILGQWQIISRRIVSGPTRCRYFQGPDIVGCTLRRIEIRVGPDRTQLSVTNIIGVGCLLDVHGVANVGGGAGTRIDFTSVGQCNFINLLTRTTPAINERFDDLNPVQVATLRIFLGPDNKSRGFRLVRHGWQVTTHRHASCIGFLHKILVTGKLLVKAPATEETQADKRS